MRGRTDGAGMAASGQQGEAATARGGSWVSAVSAAVTRRPLPVATAAVFVVTGAVSVAQFPFPQVLEALRRDPDALASGEWWRALSALLVQDPSWQVWITVPAVVALGVPVERLFGARAMVALYLVPGAVGELAGYLWQPHGAGNSVAVLGLAGGLLAWLFMEAGERDWPRPLLSRVRIWGGAMLAGAVVDTVLRDVHGLPTLAGAALGAGLLRWRRRGRRA